MVGTQLITGKEFGIDDRTLIATSDCFAWLDFADTLGARTSTDPRSALHQSGWVPDDGTDAGWRKQFLWPFEAAFLIVYLDQEYQEIMTAVRDRNHVWIMSRDPQMSEAG